MKQFVKLLCLLLPSLVLQNCTEDENLQKEKIQFTFDLSSSSADGGRVKTSEIPPDVKLIVSIENSIGESILTLVELELLHVGDNLITSPLELIPGTYKLTDFMLVSESDEILFATPRSGSLFAKLVSRPLDVNFTVQANKLNTTPMEVVSVDQSTPEDFGYASFFINVVRPLRISVFAQIANGIQLTSAKGSILKNGVVVQQFNLSASVNLIGFKLDPDDMFTLRITKVGYERFDREFSYTDLLDELNGLPLKAILTPAFTMEAVSREDHSGKFAIYMTGGYGDLNFDWGDGSTETISLTPTEIFIEHDYAVDGDYYVVVTGALDQVLSFYSYYGDGMMDEVDFYQLTELTELRFGLTRSPRVIDLTHNLELTFANLDGLLNTEIIDIAHYNKINWLAIEGSKFITDASLNAIIDDIYYSADRDARYNGFLGLAEEWWGSDIMLGPPSAASMVKLRALRDNYFWTISPEFE